MARHLPWAVPALPGIPFQRGAGTALRTGRATLWLPPRLPSMRASAMLHSDRGIALFLRLRELKHHPWTWTHHAAKRDGYVNLPTGSFSRHDVAPDLSIQLLPYPLAFTSYLLFPMLHYFCYRHAPIGFRATANDAPST